MPEKPWQSRSDASFRMPQRASHAYVRTGIKPTVTSGKSRQTFSTTAVVAGSPWPADVTMSESFADQDCALRPVHTNRQLAPKTTEIAIGCALSGPSGAHHAS